MSTTDNSTKEYPKPSLTADVIALALDPEKKGRLSVLLIRRGQDPFAGRWAIPGGFCEPTESVEQAGARELKEETLMEGLHLEQLAVFSAPGRDPRGWVVSVAHIGLVPVHRRDEAKGGDDASDARWWPIAHEPGKKPAFRLEDGAEKTGPLAFDHDDILGAGLARIRKEASRFAVGLLPERFTGTDLRDALEAILGEPAGDEVIARLVSKGEIREAFGDGDKDGGRLYCASNAAAGAH
jgi:8-oxo-dGTP diphosphatase